jgi:hypothetical protein
MMKVEELFMRNKIRILFLSVLLTATVQVLSSSAEELKGKVIMVKGNNVTIELKGRGFVIEFVNKGDKVEIYQDAYGIQVPYGTWRVSAVKGDGTLEAEPVEVKGEPI